MFLLHSQLAELDFDKVFSSEIISMASNMGYLRAMTIRMLDKAESNHTHALQSAPASTCNHWARLNPVL